MIRVINQKTDEESGRIKVTIAPQPLREGVIKWTPEHTAEIIRSMGVEVGELLNGDQVCNKPNFPNQYTFTFSPIVEKVVKKQEKSVDKIEEPVIIKKTRSRKTKSSGG